MAAPLCEDALARGHSHGHGHCHGHAHKETKKTEMMSVEDGHEGHDHGHSPVHAHGPSRDHGSPSAPAPESAAQATALASAQPGHVWAEAKRTPSPPRANGHDHAGHDHGHAHESKAAPKPAKDAHSHAHAASKPAKDAHSHAHAAPAKKSASGYSAINSCESHDDHDDHDDVPSKPKVRSGQINIDAAYLHVLGDLLQSVSVVVAGAIIWVRPDWQIADPICTLIFACLVLYTTFELIQSTLATLLMGAPEDVDVPGLLASLRAIPGVGFVHDLHVWALTAGHPVMSVHVGLDAEQSRSVDAVLRDAHQICLTLGIEHATIQVQERSNKGCVSNKCCELAVDENAGIHAV